MIDYKIKYLKKLAELYPNIASASTEIINLQSILNLPKGTEHFLSDVHGEHEAFLHVLKNSSGTVRRKINEIFGHTLPNKDKRNLATLIYYPKEKMNLLLLEAEDKNEWYRIMLFRLIKVCQSVSSKYTRSKVRKALPREFAYVIEELITEKVEVHDKESYYNSIVSTIIDTKRAELFIIALSELIQRLIIDHLHIVGDIYDRGNGAPQIMDKLLEYHSLDIQWGNHDVLWMGAAAGHWACIANVVRICVRYGNLDTLKEGYGINLLPLATYAMDNYKDDNCECFKLKATNNAKEDDLNLKIHKAITILQFKIEGQLISENKEFGLEDRNLLHKINYENKTIVIKDKTYNIKDSNFPTVDKSSPYTLTIEEKEVMDKLSYSFLNCEKLQKHVKLLLSKGGLYKIYNNNLLYHGCMLLENDGSFKKIRFLGKEFYGKAWFDFLESYIRKGLFSENYQERKFGKNMMWYTWLHKNSPIFGKDKMATFERYLVKEKEIYVEKKNPYYLYCENEEVIDNIIKNFGLDPAKAHVINGHVPVKVKQGEHPIKCNGKLFIIDGGFSKAYQNETGIAGYTLIYNSHGLILVSHKPFTNTEDAILEDTDINTDTIKIVKANKRELVGDTDVGIKMKETIADLYELLEAYREGILIEQQL
ncbi:fructose 1,6-bisphosphatase [Candidatus Epulonipiscium fishelsonii]|uniref:Fructose 1,6-bisphosphatase n=1 Tax=Candidatus Epulonipiscium fishelsonii TaxID=77094 RepID=A0ACC8XGV7_9FIRM|nr:fructose 1,6-bisphosphatase [Epulopiscium sp. SCG-B05WGA-EpuloA1]ONI42774.1 fructose 1,6-bisphosphatase [Epulopiscium sp. SCG-B11WGA-EpuloA1]